MQKLLTLLLLYGTLACGQKALHGKVVDQVTGEALVGANVFIANSTQQTLTNEAGQFSIMMPEHAAQLVITYVGYDPQVLGPADFPDRLVRYVVPMRAEVTELKPVAVLSAKARKSMLDTFYAYFLGTTENARQTSILNPDDITFHLGEDGSWEATASEPLLIENRNLSYKISFVLADFRMLPGENKCYYAGYPAFSDLKPPTRKVLSARRSAYLGSQMHFIRSAYHNTLREEGFTLNHYMRERNSKYPTGQRYREYLKELRLMARKGTVKQPEPEFSMKLLAPNANPDWFVTGENGERSLEFPHTLDVIYSGSFEEGQYAGHRETGHQHSLVYLEVPRAQIYPDGNIANVDSVIFEGYMAWKKMADQVPNDYQP